MRQKANWTGYSGPERVKRSFTVKQEVGWVCSVGMVLIKIAVVKKTKRLYYIIQCETDSKLAGDRGTKWTELRGNKAKVTGSSRTERTHEIQWDTWTQQDSPNPPISQKGEPFSISLRPMKYHTQAIQWASRAKVDMSSVSTTALYCE